MLTLEYLAAEVKRLMYFGMCVYVCVCECVHTRACFLPTITRLAKGLAITFPHLPSATTQKTLCRLNIDMLVGAKRDHQQGCGCSDQDQIAGLGISPGVCITLTLGYGTRCILETLFC